MFWEMRRRNQGSSRSVAQRILHMEKQRGSDKVIANERTAESRIETAVGVQSRAVRSSSSRDVSSHSATSSIASALSLLYIWLDAQAKSDFHEDPQFDGF